MTLTKITKLIAILGGLFSASIPLIAADYSNLYMVPLALAFAGLTASPFILIYYRASSCSHALTALLMFLTCIFVSASSVYIYWTTFIDNSNPDAQDGIILLLFPIYQLVVIGVVLLVTGFLSKVLK